jgi:hypothetical protein
MKLRFRLLKGLHDRVREDLARRHEFAFERVGFVSAKLGNRGTDEVLVLATNYHPVADENYIDDPRSGARINSAAIREAMQLVLDTGEGLFHVHWHAHRGRPGFSSMDLKETPRIVSGLRVVGPDQAHGMLLLSNNHCIAHVWTPAGSEPVVADGVTIVGYPMEILE